MVGSLIISLRRPPLELIPDPVWNADSFASQYHNAGSGIRCYYWPKAHATGPGRATDPRSIADALASKPTVCTVQLWIWDQVLLAVGYKPL